MCVGDSFGLLVSAVVSRWAGGGLRGLVGRCVVLPSCLVVGRGAGCCASQTGLGNVGMSLHRVQLMTGGDSVGLRALCGVQWWFGFSRLGVGTCCSGFIESKNIYCIPLCVCYGWDWVVDMENGSGSVCGWRAVRILFECWAARRHHIACFTGSRTILPFIKDIAVCTINY